MSAMIYISYPQSVFETTFDCLKPVFSGDEQEVEMESEDSYN